MQPYFVDYRGKVQSAERNVWTREGKWCYLEALDDERNQWTHGATQNT